MKKSVFTILLALVSLFAQAQDDGMTISGSLMFNENSDEKEAFVLVSDANLRDKPSTKATAVAQLPIATKVQILEKTKDSLTLNGFRAAWFKVSANGKTGYLWSGILTTVGIMNPYENNEDVTYVAGISSYNEKENKLTLQVRAAKNGKEIAKIDFPSVGDLGYQLSLGLQGSNFSKVKEVLSVKMIYGACDYPQGDNLVIFTEGGKLVRLMEVTSASSAGAGYSSENYILPNDKGGINGHVLVIEDSATQEEVTKNGKPDFVTKDHKYKITLHKWTGAKLEKIFSR